MKEFVEKLIGRLEEEKEAYSDTTYYALGVGSAIKIVNQLAEEYNTKDCSKCSRRSWYQIGYKDAEKNNGWIPCSERLPETYEYVLVWCKGRFIDGTHVGEECEWYGIGVMYGKKWTVYQCKDIRDIEVLAWMSLPAPFKKGE